MTIAEPAPRTRTITELPTDRLTIGEDVRLDEDGDALGELAASIAAIGVLQPLVVRTSVDGWEVVAGRRRLAASRIADLETVPCIVVTMCDMTHANGRTLVGWLIAVASRLSPTIHRPTSSPVSSWEAAL